MRCCLPLISNASFVLPEATCITASTLWISCCSCAPRRRYRGTQHPCGVSFSEAEAATPEVGSPACRDGLRPERYGPTVEIARIRRRRIMR